MSHCGSNKSISALNAGYAASTRRRRFQRGFTLLEVIIVSVIVFILVTATTASLSGFLTRSRLRAAVSRLTSMAVYARSHSLTTGDRIVLHADRNADTVGLFRYDLTADDPELLPLESRWQMRLPDCVVISYLEVDDEETEQADIVFFPDGSATAARMKLLLQSGGYTTEEKVVSINGLTGRVTIQ